ncbi:hypothetical protein B0J18DRAFT_121105 [Chaetomium sp. MPI-SDFR-AT-0129]|nr:hypothetical protein B0J18DRAFT_121105 [Chaetomium sp. MPI-SDFR-AT-0129]
MPGYASRIPSLKGTPRLQATGLKSAASNNWRNRAAGTSLPETNSITGQRSCDSSEDSYVRAQMEAGNIISDPQYRYLRDKKAAWEHVVSAPGMGIPSSSSSISADYAGEGTKVQLKRVKPIYTAVNGQTIALPNRFVLDVVAVDPHNTPLSSQLGDLKSLNGHATFRRISTEDSDKLFLELQQLARSSEETFSSAASGSSKSQGFSQKSQTLRRPIGYDGADSATIRPRVSKPAPSPAASVADEPARYQKLLSRLHLRPETSASHHQGPAAATLTARRAVDPAIMALKAKTETQTEPLERRELDDRFNEAKRIYLAEQRDSQKRAGQHNQTDSGYGPSSRGQHSSDHSTGGNSQHEAHHHREQPFLNPAAAEFKSTHQEESADPNGSTFQDDVPRVSPKKLLSRQPLTNIFPDVMSDTKAGKEGSPSQQVRQAAPEPSTQHGSQHINGGSNPNATPPSPSSGFPTLANAETFHSWYETFGFAPPFFVPQGASPMMGTVAAAGISAGTPAMNNGFNTFSTSGTGPVPMYPQAAMPGGMNPYHTMAAPFAPAIPPQFASHGRNGKRYPPYYPAPPPKPREPDAAQQNDYEKYLEWRKSNEPGYYMQCKIRQANRVMRQFQRQNPGARGAPGRPGGRNLDTRNPEN